jgi:hypothetical protein
MEETKTTKGTTMTEETKTTKGTTMTEETKVETTEAVETQEETTEAVETQEDKLIAWWAPNKEDDDAFIVEITDIEQGEILLRTINALEHYMRDKKLKTAIPAGGGMAYLTPKGELRPWEHVSVEDGGRVFTDAIEYLNHKRAKNKIEV